MNKSLKGIVGIGIVSIPLAILAGYYAGKSGAPEAPKQISEAERARRVMVCGRVASSLGTTLPISIVSWGDANGWEKLDEFEEFAILERKDDGVILREDYRRAVREILRDMEPFKLTKDKKQLAAMVEVAATAGCLNG